MAALAGAPRSMRFGSVSMNRRGCIMAADLHTNLARSGWLGKKKRCGKRFTRPAGACGQFSSVCGRGKVRQLLSDPVGCPPGLKSDSVRNEAASCPGG